MSGNNFVIDSSAGFSAPCSELEGLMNCVRYNEEGDMELVVEYLSQHPEAIDGQDAQGRTLIHMAAANGHIGALMSLLDFSPTSDIPNNEGNTALHFAALNKCIPTASILLDHGWKASTVNHSGQTPLQLISQQRGFEEMENFLLAYDDSLDAAASSSECDGENEEREDAVEKSVPSCSRVDVLDVRRGEGKREDSRTTLCASTSVDCAPLNAGIVCSSPPVGAGNEEKKSAGSQFLTQGTHLGSANMEEIE